MGKFLKITSYPTLLLFVAVALFTGGCTCPKSPVPTVTISPEGGFSIKVDSISGADQVKVSTFDADSTLLDTVTLALNGQHNYNYGPDVKRPVRVKMSYLKNQQVVAKDEVDVEDVPGNPGNPLAGIDVIMGYTSPPPTPNQCPTPQLVATGYGKAIVSWAPGDWFEIHMTHSDSSVEKVGIKMENSPTAGNPGIAKVYRSDGYSCMTRPEYDASNVKYMKLTPSNNEFGIYGTDNIDNVTPRLLYIENKSNLLITVLKKN